MEDFSAKFTESLLGNLFSNSVQEIARQGAELMLKLALEAEIEDFLKCHHSKLTADGHQRIVRNGYHKERKLQTGIGELSIKVPRCRDRLSLPVADVSDNESKGSHATAKVEYESHLIPKYLRRCEALDEFIPFLYLTGVSSTRFSDVLSQLLDKPTSLSPGTLGRLKENWQKEYDNWNSRNLSNRRYVYWWVDGVYFNVRGEADKNCALVIIGASEDGTKELVAMEIGYSESEIKWHEMLLDLKSRGLMDGPRLAIGDGALGFWKALKKTFPQSIHQRCWVHRTRNVLSKLPKSLQKQAKGSIHNIYQAPTRKEAEKAFDKFVGAYEAKYPKAVECLIKTKEETMAFYGFPAEHWRHIRSTNVIESVFASVRLRTYKTKGCCSAATILPMAFQLVKTAQIRWQRIHSSNIIPMVFNRELFIDGVRHAA